VSRFDVVALQEIKRDLGGLRLLMHALGSNWGWSRKAKLIGEL